MEDNNAEVSDNINEKTEPAPPIEKKKSPDYHVASQRQLDHLAYARNMKKLKQEARNQEVDLQNKNLDIIYRRLTGIEKNLTHVLDQIPEVTHATKRKRTKRRKDEESSEEPPKKRKENNTVTPTSYDTFMAYGTKAVLIGTGAFIFNFLKHYASARGVKTGDGDPVNTYFQPKEF